MVGKSAFASGNPKRVKSESSHYLHIAEAECIVTFFKGVLMHCLMFNVSAILSGINSPSESNDMSSATDYIQLFSFQKMAKIMCFHC